MPTLLIKDIRQFREFFKENIRETNDPKRDPHFAGHSRKTEQGNVFGFFDLYHGMKPDMENMLKTVLEMARDSQALYEFMQNAVDARSSDFLLFHHLDSDSGQHYLVVANNGKPFDLRGVLAILNIAASNKYRDSESIGQFGVGFKLAHRLVGEEEGLKALMEENKGPVLFSWENNELVDLVNSEGLTHVPNTFHGIGDEAACDGKEPWLFKILYTNFPCRPGEEIVDANESAITDAFTDTELAILRNVAQQCLADAQAQNYTTGSLLLIPLHPSKISELTEDAVRYGLEISTAILNHRHGDHPPLERIMLNGEPLSTVETEGERFRYDTDLQLFPGIKTLEIDFLYGDALNNNNPFKGKPQFYLYFPMTEERHGFWFAVHCNGFSFTTARTALQDKSAVNKEIFARLNAGLRDRLVQYSTNTNEKPRFERLYTAILLSSKGENGQWKENREWLEEDFWQGLMQLARDFAPVLDSASSWRLAQPTEQVLINGSSLPLNEWHTGNGAWFYWNKAEQLALCHAAGDKLEAKNITLIDVLEQDGAPAKINEWLAGEAGRTEKILAELNNNHHQISGRKDTAINAIWANAAKLRLWTFGETCFSIDELSGDGYDDHLISFGPITATEVLMTKAGFRVSREKLDSYPEIQHSIKQRNSARLPYLNNSKELNILLSTRFKDPELFSPEEKQRLFEAITKSIRDSANNASNVLPDRMKPLALFANVRGEVKPLEELIQLPNLPESLRGWAIRQSEIGNLDLSPYTAYSPETAYESIVLKSWLQIATHLAGESPSARVEAFEVIKSWHTAKPAMPALPAEAIAFSEDGPIIMPEALCYHPSLITDWEKGAYDVLNRALRKCGIGQLPQYSLLLLYHTKPFALQSTTSTPFHWNEDGTPVSLSKREAEMLLRFVQKVDEEALKEVLIRDRENGAITIEKKPAGVFQCLSASPVVEDYVKSHCVNSLVLLPNALHDQGNYVILNGDRLINRLIYDFSDREHLSDIIEVVGKQAGEETKRAFLRKLASAEPLPINGSLTAGQPIVSLIKMCLELDDAEGTNLLGELVAVEVAGTLSRLNAISERGSDLFTVQGKTREYEFSVSAILGDTKTNTINELLTNAAVQLAGVSGVGTREKIEEAFGIHARRTPTEVLEDLQNADECSPTSDAARLAFILAVAEQNLDLLKEFEVLTLNGWISLADATALYECGTALSGMLSDAVLLSEQYAGTLAYLKTAVGDVYECGKLRMLHKPFINEGRLIAPESDTKSQALNVELIRYISSLWLQSGRPERLALQYSDEHWEDLFGFDPRCLILDQSLQSEAEAKDLSEILQILNLATEDATPFLRSIGAQGPGSPLALWRRYLSGQSSHRPEDQLYSANALRTLYWMSATQIAVDGEKVAFLYYALSQPALESLPLPVWLPSNQGLTICIPDDDRNWLLMPKKEMDTTTSHNIALDQLANAHRRGIVPEIAALNGLWEKLVSLYDSIIITWDDVDWSTIQVYQEEWAQDWYQKWAETYNAKIFTFPSELPKHVRTGGQVVKSYQEGVATSDPASALIHYVSRRLHDGAAIEEIAKLGEMPPTILQALRKAYDSHQSYVSTLFQTIKDREVLAEVQQKLEEAGRLQERQEAADRLKDAANKYTLQWFKDLLELVKKQESITGAPTIIFDAMRPTGHPGIWELSHGSGYIPRNLEEYEHVTATIFYQDANGKVTHQITRIEPTLKQQRLWARFPEAAIQPVLAEPITKVVINFARTIDLMQALKTGFEGLGYIPGHNLRDTLSHNIRFIYGPPGTGKTTEVARQLAARMDAGTPGPVVVLTPTNKAADVLCHKILKDAEGAAPTWLRRFGTCNDPVLIEKEIVAGRDLVVNETERVVVITTIHRFPYAKVRLNYADTDATVLCNAPWALVVFDEASMIPLPYAAFAIHKRAQAFPDTQFLVAGDPRQIPPVFDLSPDDIEKPDNAEELQKENIYTMVGLNSFDELEQGQIPIYGEQGLIQNLTVQHRSVAVIGDLFSRFQYGGTLTHSRELPTNNKPATSRALPKYFQELGFRPITVIRYKVDSGETIYNPKKLNRSPLHLQSALLVNALLKRFNEEVMKEKMDKWTVGVISPYKSQALLMDKMLEHSVGYSNVMETSVDTVHGFQGDENQLVVTVLNPSSENAAYSRFLKEAHILNVAISRSEDYLILFVPDENTDGFNNLSLLHHSFPHSILGIIRALPVDLVTELHASTLEESLMNEALHFEKHTRTTAHLPVNVYGAPDTTYLFRMGGNAVDVHW